RARRPGTAGCGVVRTRHHRVLGDALRRGEPLGEAGTDRRAVLLRAGLLLRLGGYLLGGVLRGTLPGRGAAHACPPSSPSADGCSASSAVVSTSSAGSAVFSAVHAPPSASRSAFRATATTRSPGSGLA